MSQAIPVIDIGTLYEEQADKSPIDAAIGRALHDIGFMVITGAQIDFGNVPNILRFFSLPDPDKMRLAKNIFRNENPNAYRGYFPVEPEKSGFKEGIDLGPFGLADDNGESPKHVQENDPLLEHNVWPDEKLLPQWKTQATQYFRECEALGGVILQSVARYLQLPEGWFTDKFVGHASTFRPMRYPQQDSNALATPEGGDAGDLILCGAHVDSGFMTILYQDDVGGLRVKSPSSPADSPLWLDVPPKPKSFVINIGKAMQRWSNGYFIATEHMVVTKGKERFSMPFFFEPALPTSLSTIPSPILDSTNAPEDVTYRAFMTANMKKFIEYRGLFEDKTKNYA